MTITLRREPISEAKFRETNNFSPHLQPSFGNVLLRGVKTYDYKKRARTTFLPFVDSLKGYSKSSFFSDLIAAVTVAFIRLPQGLAYGALANVPPINGLYTEFFTCLFYSFFATSRHISVGTFAVLSLMVGTMVEDIDFAICTNGTAADNNQTNNAMDEYDSIPLADEECATQLKLQYVVSATMLCGVLQVAFGIFQIGKLSLLLPRHVVQGFTTAAAFFVLTSQVTVMLGLTKIHVPRNMDVGGLFVTWINIFKSLKHANIGSIVVSIICISVLVPIKWASRTYKEKLRGFPIPGELLLVVVFAISQTFAPKWGSLGKIPDVGEIPQGLPHPVLPDVTLWPKMITEVIPISVVAYSTNLSLGKLFAFKNNYTIDAMQEALAIGLANICSAFFSSIPGAASLSRSSLQEASGGRTQLAGIMSCIVILIFLLFAGPYFSVIPKALLASVIAVNLRGMFIQFHELPELWKFSKVDFWVWVGSFVSVLVFGIDLGLGLAILILLLSIVVRMADVAVSELGATASGDIFRETEQYDSLTLQEYPIYKLPGSLDFASVEKVLVALPRRGQMLLDFSEVSYIDIVGRNTIEAVIKHLDFVGFCCVNEKTMRLLEVSGIAEEINVGIFPTLLDGLAILKEKNEMTTSSDLSRESDDSKL